jgi:hypothetical protein
VNDTGGTRGSFGCGCTLWGSPKHTVCPHVVSDAHLLAHLLDVWYAVNGQMPARSSPDCLLIEHMFESCYCVQVLARSSPEDKRTLVRTLRSMGEVVAVTVSERQQKQIDPASAMESVRQHSGCHGTTVWA